MKIGDVAKFQNGFAFKSSDFKKNGKFPIIKIKELKDGEVKFFSDSVCVDVDLDAGYRKFLVQEGDVLFALTGDPVNKPNPLSWVGRVSVYNHKEEALINQRVCKLLPTKKVNPKYIYYFFRDFENFYRLASLATGSASQANISTKAIENVEIDIPPINVQNRMIEYLDAISKKIEINNQINDNLESQLLLIYKSWFIDLEPFNKILPDDWGSSPLGEKCNCLLGGTPSRNKPEFWNGTIPWINSGKVNSFRIIEPSEYITVLGLEKSATKLLPAKTVVIAITGATLGQVSLLEIDSCANQSVVGILQNEEIPYEFIYPFIKFKINELISHQTGGAQQHINKQNVENIIIQIPSKNVMKKYINTVSPMYELIENICIENQKLLQLRNTLLPKLISGELDISDIEF